MPREEVEQVQIVVVETVAVGLSPLVLLARRLLLEPCLMGQTNVEGIGRQFTQTSFNILTGLTMLQQRVGVLLLQQQVKSEADK